MLRAATALGPVLGSRPRNAWRRLEAVGSSEQLLHRLHGSLRSPRGWCATQGEAHDAVCDIEQRDGMVKVQCCARVVQNYMY